MIASKDTLKRLFDLIVSATAVIFLLPLMSAVICVIIFDLGFPVFFKQERPGENGRLFKLIKFRTMTQERTPDGSALDDEKRLSKAGRLIRSLSLDEWPSLFNVIVGHMSLVGPRPLLPEYLGRYSQEQMRRHLVKPGITGWAQINGRNTLTWEQRFNLDVWYVYNQTIILDLKILFKTVLKVVSREGINYPGLATMDRFQGSGGAHG